MRTSCVFRLQRQMTVSGVSTQNTSGPGSERYQDSSPNVGRARVEPTHATLLFTDVTALRIELCR
jgi:hypothetical protein